MGILRPTTTVATRAIVSVAMVLVVVMMIHVRPITGQFEESINSSQVDCTHCGVEICPERCPSKNKTLFIQGFVPANNSVYESETIIPAAWAAIDDVNANCSILPGYLLELTFVNTLCDPSEATWQLINSIVLKEKEQEDRIMFLGGGCSLATEPLAALSGRFYNVTMVSYGASSPSLSSLEMFPNFFRTIPSEVQSNSARFALMMKYGWTRVATLHETQTIFSETVDNFHEQYGEVYGKNITQDEDDDNLILRSFTDDPEIPLRQIREKDIRIIMGYFYEDKAVATLCQAIKSNLTSDNHVWMFPAWYSPDWFKNNSSVNCTVEELAKAVNNSFFLDSYNTSDPSDSFMQTETGSTTTELFQKKFACYLDEFKSNPYSMKWTTQNSTAHAYIGFTYDAVWAMAFALDETEKELERDYENLTLGDFSYFGKTPISAILTKHMNKTNFIGVSGNVIFNQYGDRVSLNGIYQLRENENGELEQQLIAIHNPGIEENGRFNYNFTFIMKPSWKGDGPPSDRRQPQDIYLNRQLVAFCHFLTSVAIVVALALLTFNLVTICKPLIRDSAPYINIIVIIGCIVMLVGCYLLGIDSNNPQIKVGEDDSDSASSVWRDLRYKIVCIVRLWVLTLGFTFSFGALFAKTWQVYRVYTNAELKKKEFKMWNFLLIMVIFVIIDVAYLIFWTVRYPFYRDIAKQTKEEEDIVKNYEVCQCENFGYLIGALYVYKGLLVVFGLFLAYESRNVKYFYINDSRFVSITMYIVVILVGIGAPLSLVLAVHYFIDAAYSLAVFMITAACMACLLVLYIPKFFYMAKGRDTMVSENTREEITVSDGLQLGRSTVDTIDVKSAEDEVSNLQKQVTEKSLELQVLQNQSVTQKSNDSKPRTGSDGDSGVLVTVDENETFSTESTANGEQMRSEGGGSVTPVVTGRIDTSTPTTARDDEGDDEGREKTTTEEEEMEGQECETEKAAEIEIA